MEKKSLIAALLALSAAGALATIPTANPPDPGRSAANAARAQLFMEDQGEPRAVLLLRDGKPLLKHYAPGYSDANRFISWSMAKTVTAVLVGELVSEGRLKLDEPAPFAEWQKPGDPRSGITLRQMLHMAAGLRHEETGPILEKSDTNRTLFVDGTQAMAAAALAQPLEAKPGSLYEYSSLTSLLLSELITRTLTESKDPAVRAAAYRAFAEERLFGPAGITSAVLEFDAAGTQVGGSIIYMSLDDWGRFGQVLLDGRVADGPQIIAPDWMAFLRAPADINPEYGGHLWLNRSAPGKAATDNALFPGHGRDSAFAAIGHLGQYVIVSPEDRTVLVRLGKTNDPELGPVRAALGRVMDVVKGEKR